MTIDNTESQMRKGLLELCILGIIFSQKEVYPSDILTQLKEAKLVVLEGTLYPLLTRLKKCRLAQLPVGGITLWSTTEILQSHSRWYKILRTPACHLG